MNVTNETELLNAITSYEPNIVISNSFNIANEITINYTVNIYSSSNLTLIRGNNNTIFKVNENGDLTLNNIVLNGNNINVCVPLLVNNNRLKLNHVTICNANSSASGAGIYCSNTSTYTFIKECEFYNCITQKNGGAIYHDGENTIFVKNNNFSSNKAILGGAIYLNSTGTLNLYKNIFERNDSSNGGAIYCDSNSTLEIGTNNTFENNNATNGKDIYNKGIFYLNGHNNILSGLYLYDENSIIRLVNTIIGSYILIEESDYVSPINANSPITIATDTQEYYPLSDEDLLVFRKPTNHFENWQLQKKDDESKIELAIQVNTYTITYLNLQGATNSNPVTYTINDVPIPLQDPILAGNEFLGWLDENEQPISEISSSSVGNRTLKATWRNAVIYEISFNGNSQNPVTNLPPSINVSPGETVTLPNNIPKRRGYIFLNWNTSQDGTGTTYYPNQTITDIRESLVLYAIWYKFPTQCSCCPVIYYCLCCKCRKKLKEVCNCRQKCNCKFKCCCKKC